MTSTTPTVPAAAPAASGTQRFRVNHHDRASLILTLVVTAIALIAGLVLRGAVESYTKGYKTPQGVFIEYPDTWQLNTTDASGVVRAKDSAAQNFATTLELRVVSVDSAAKDNEALSYAANQVALNRGQEQSNFKVFDLTAGQTIKGLPAATSSFVFVSDTSSALQEGLPVVVLGDDTLVRKGGTVYIFSALSTEENHAQATAQLKAFVDSAQLP
jgi:hypothetical protein